jgi:DNA-directed RNA polymerase specialized sigma24 family protein
LDDTRGSDPSDETVAEQVRSAEELWRAHANQIHALGRGLEGLGWPEAAMRDLMRHAEDARRFWTERVRSRLGFDFDDPGTWRFVDLGEREFDPAVFALKAALFWDTARTAMQRAYARQEEEGNPHPAPEVCRAYLWVWLEVAPMLEGLVFERCTDERWRADAAVSLAGWNAAGMREGADPELDRALARFGGSYRDQLHQQIAGATLVAWSDLRAEHRLVPTKLRTRAQAEMIDDVGRRKKVPRPGGGYHSLPPVSWSDLDDPKAADDVEAFVLAHEAERAVRDVLSPREAEVWELYQAGYSYKEIAERCGIRIGTVGGTLSRVEKKRRGLRQAGLA